MKQEEKDCSGVVVEAGANWSGRPYGVGRTQCTAGRAVAAKEKAVKE